MDEQTSITLHVYGKHGLGPTHAPFYGHIRTQRGEAPEVKGRNVTFQSLREMVAFARRERATEIACSCNDPDYLTDKQIEVLGDLAGRHITVWCKNYGDE